jgi:hypothetical protein
MRDDICWADTAERRHSHVRESAAPEARLYCVHGEYLPNFSSASSPPVIMRLAWVRQKVSKQALAQGFDGWDTKTCRMYDPSGSSPGQGNDCSAVFEAFEVDRCHGKDNH